MRRELPAPRLLPATIFAMSVVLGLKCVGLAGAAAKEAQAADAAQTTPTLHATGTATGTVDIPAGAPAGGHAEPGKKPPPPQLKAEAAAKLDSERAALQQKEEALRQRQSLIDAAEQKLDQRVAELKALQAQLEKDQTAQTADQEKHWDDLVQLYQRMKPRDAARILDGMDTPVVVRLIARMKQLRAAPILAAMSPDRARDVTAGLADRQASSK